jgi:hypothetical protein
MTNIANEWAPACAHVPGMSASSGTAMSAFWLATAVRKPATVDAHYTAQGDHRAWSPPV